MSSSDDETSKTDGIPNDEQVEGDTKASENEGEEGPVEDENSLGLYR